VVTSRLGQQVTYSDKLGKQKAPWRPWSPHGITGVPAASRHAVLQQVPTGSGLLSSLRVKNDCRTCSMPFLEEHNQSQTNSMYFEHSSLISLPGLPLAVASKRIFSSALTQTHCGKTRHLADAHSDDGRRESAKLMFSVSRCIGPNADTSLPVTSLSPSNAQNVQQPASARAFLPLAAGTLSLIVQTHLLVVLCLLFRALHLGDQRQSKVLTAIFPESKGRTLWHGHHCNPSACHRPTPHCGQATGRSQQKVRSQWVTSPELPDHGVMFCMFCMFCARDLHVLHQFWETRGIATLKIKKTFIMWPNLTINSDWA